MTEEEEDEEGSLCSLRVCEAEIQTDGQQLRTTMSSLIFFFQTPPLFLFAVTVLANQEEPLWFS